MATNDNPKTPNLQEIYDDLEGNWSRGWAYDRYLGTLRPFELVPVVLLDFDREIRDSPSRWVAGDFFCGWPFLAEAIRLVADGLALPGLLDAATQYHLWFDGIAHAVELAEYDKLDILLGDLVSNWKKDRDGFLELAGRWLSSQDIEDE